MSLKSLSILSWFQFYRRKTNKSTQTNNKPQANWIYDSQYFLQQHPRPQSRHDISQTSHLLQVLSPADLALLTSWQLHRLQEYSIQQLLPLQNGDERQVNPAVKKGLSGINQPVHGEALSLRRPQTHGAWNLCALEPHSHKGECHR